MNVIYYWICCSGVYFLWQFLSSINFYIFSYQHFQTQITSKTIARKWPCATFSSNIFPENIKFSSKKYKYVSSAVAVRRRRQTPNPFSQNRPWADEFCWELPKSSKNVCILCRLFAMFVKEWPCNLLHEWNRKICWIKSPYF